MKKLPKRFYNLTFSLLMAIMMSAVMSFVVTSYNLGFSEQLIWSWLKAWRLAFFTAFPILMVVSPLVRRFTAKIVAP